MNGRTTISTLVDVPRGTSKLLLKVDPPPASEQDAIVISAPRAERSSGTPVLHAEFVGPLTLPRLLGFHRKATLLEVIDDHI